ncbi:hypothetical protein bcgnr5390_15810 [Bacillus luti]|nr:hypothetical protein BC2903_45770 [Bacillus cereus]
MLQKQNAIKNILIDMLKETKVKTNIFKGMLLKKRPAKNSDRGLYIQDMVLKMSEFKPGSSYKYVIDPKNNKLIIVPTNEKGNKVSKRKIKSGLKPVIDIRNKDALQMFKGAELLEIEIFGDRIVVTGYEETKEDAKEEKSTMFSKAAKAIAKVLSKEKKVIDITKRLNRKKKFEFVMSKKQLANVAGDYVQTSIFDFLESNDSTSFNNVPSSVKEGIRNVKIPLQAISLFSGAGVMDQGFFEQGFDITLAIEKDPEAYETYLHNFGSHIVNADITEFDFKRFEENGAPVMFGGSPCQGFSNSNRYTNFLDNPNNSLVNSFIKAVKANKNCQVFVLENVPQILTAGGGKFKDEIIAQLSEFEITYGVINAADMGAPQLRKRAIFIGSKIGKIELPKPKLQPHEYMTVGEALKGLDDSIPNQLDYSKPKPSTVERMKHIAQGQNWEAIPAHLKTERMSKGGTHSSVYRRLEENKPAFTLTNFRKSNITHYLKNRILSIREGARLFGLPDSFVFKGKISSMQQQIANAVPVQLASSVAQVIKEAIQRWNIRNGFEKLQIA